MGVTLCGQLICASVQELATLLDALPEHIRLSRSEPGCLRFDVSQRDDEPLVFDVEEAFADDAAFEAHRTRTRDSAWWNKTQHIRREFSRS